jgi:hypothetical protein
MQIIINFLLVPAALATVALFVGVITRSDPMPLIRQGAYILGFRQLVLFSDAIPPNLQDNLDVADVERIDTDGDGFNEWVVFYRFDLQDGRSPVQAVVYDNDRGSPPVIFPYALRPPDRDYLSEGGVSIDMEQITSSPDSEVVVRGDSELNIFEFRQNSEEWDFPRDAPFRYIPIGFFKGSGGVSLGDDNRVTVIDRNGFERSQLSIRSVYVLRETVYRVDNSRTEIIESYLDELDQTRLAAPVVSTIDFYRAPPEDILGTTFPEKIVLAFYASTCSDGDLDTLCRRADQGWVTRDFLAPQGEALQNFEDGNTDYFGLSSFSTIPDLSVSHLRYYPQLETDADLLVEGGGRDVVTGEQAQMNVVDIVFTTSNGFSAARRFQMELIEGQWKIVSVRQIPFELPPLAPTSDVSQ